MIQQQSAMVACDSSQAENCASISISINNAILILVVMLMCELFLFCVLTIDSDTFIVYRIILNLINSKNSFYSICKAKNITLVFTPNK